MKIKIISADIIFYDDIDKSIIKSIELKWKEKNGIIMKKNFNYEELCNNLFLFKAFKDFYPEFNL